MNKRAFTLLSIAALSLAACAFGYQARGALSDLPGELRGKAFPGNTSGGGRFSLADRGGQLSCDGLMAAPDHSPVAGYCEGESGPGTVICSDGRQLAVRWTAITCRSFQGSGEDKFGNRLVFRVDRSR